MPHRDAKNHKVTSDDRHSRMGVSGEAKKCGGGGSYTWGKEGDEVNAESGVSDPRDPNYNGDAKLPPVPAYHLTFDEVSKEVAAQSTSV